MSKILVIGTLAIMLALPAAGFGQLAWLPYAQNPIMPDTGSVSMVLEPSVVYDPGAQLYHMWYAKRDYAHTSGLAIYHAISYNKTAWVDSPSTPVMLPGSSGQYDMTARGPSVIKDGSGYKMYYLAQGPSGFSIAVATSPNGLVWTKYAGNPILTQGASGTWESNYIVYPNAYFDGSTYFMWYSGFDGSNENIGLATSADGFHWTKYPGNPILRHGDTGWDSLGVHQPSVTVLNGAFYMLFAGSRSMACCYAEIGLATSSDGVHWAKYDGNPVFAGSSPGSWDGQAVAAGSVIYADSKFNMWYTGYTSSTGVFQIGFASSTHDTIPPPPSPDSNAVAIWHFDEAAGSVLHDATIYHNDGTIHDAAWVPGKFGSALKFNGSTSYVNLPNTDALKQAEEFTLEAWIAVDVNFVPVGATQYGVQYQILSNLGSYPYGGGYCLYINVVQSAFNLMLAYRTQNGVSNYSDPVPYPKDSTFHHVAATYKRIGPSSALVQLFLDGAPKDSVVLNGLIQYDNTPTFYIGTNRDGASQGGFGIREFPGLIDEVRISNVVRSPGDFGAGRLTVDKPTIDYGLVQIGTSQSVNLNVSNTMFTNGLHVDSITSTNPVFGAAPTSFDLPPLSSQNVAVTYTPGAAQADTGTLTIYASGLAAQIATVHLAGRGFQLQAAPVIFSVKDIPDDQGRQVRVAWYSSIDDAGGDPFVTEYSVWRRVDDPVAMKAYIGGQTSSVPDAKSRRIMVNGDLWDYITTVPALQFEKYSFVAPTLRNANPTSFNWAVFRVAAHLSDNTFFISDPDSGYSLDNMFPPPPPSLTAQSDQGRIDLGWQPSAAPDVAQYRVYRSTSSTVVPSPYLRIGWVHATAFIDSTGDKDSIYYYTVTAVDSSGNESPQSNNTGGMKILGVGVAGGQIPQRYEISQNYPNPFNPSTEIKYALPMRSRVTLTIYDVLGREVLALIAGETLDAGMYHARWNAAVASGVYFYRFQADAVASHQSFTSTGKMLLLK